MYIWYKERRGINAQKSLKCDDKIRKMIFLNKKILKSASSNTNTLHNSQVLKRNTFYVTNIFFVQRDICNNLLTSAFRTCKDTEMHFPV